MRVEDPIQVHCMVSWHSTGYDKVRGIVYSHLAGYVIEDTVQGSCVTHWHISGYDLGSRQSAGTVFGEMAQTIEGMMRVENTEGRRG